MSWFSDRIGKLSKPGGTAVLDREGDAEHSQTPSGPALIMLVADAHGVASYRLHTYRDTAPAKAFLEYWFPKSLDTGVIVFWALTDEPDDTEVEVEPMVLVRDVAKHGVIYPFSFVDMDAAQAFARQEVEKGLGLDSVMIYWAASVNMERDDWGSLQMSPMSPPRSRREPTKPGAKPVTKLVEPAADVAAQIAQTVIPAVPMVEARVEAVVLDTAPVTMRVLNKASVGTGTVKGGGSTTAVMDRSASVVANPGTPRASKAGSRPAKPRVAKKAPGILEEPLVIESAIPEELGGAVITNGSEAVNRHRIHDERTFDMEKELLKVLQVKRWDTQEGPFRGIDSPPGRF